MRLHDLAHARCGDKGNAANISVTAYDRTHYPHLVKHLTSMRVRAHFGARVKGDIHRYELPTLGALNFVLHDALEGGVTRSLGLDPHGKSLSSVLLSLELPDVQTKGSGPPTT
jgi:hypothetical protein